MLLSSGAGTNLKAGDTGTAQSTGNFFFGGARPLFLPLKVQLVVMVSAFVMVSFLFAVLLLCHL